MSRNLSVIASYAYLHNVTTQSNDTTATIDGNQTPLRGKQPFGIPRNMASAWADYTAARSMVSDGVRYLGASYDTSNSIHVPSVTQVDAAEHCDTGKHWLLSLNAQNLFNRQYIASCFGATTCTFGDGAKVLASARYRW